MVFEQANRMMCNELTSSLGCSLSLHKYDVLFYFNSLLPPHSEEISAVLPLDFFTSSVF